MFKKKKELFDYDYDEFYEEEEFDEDEVFGQIADLYEEIHDMGNGKNAKRKSKPNKKVKTKTRKQKVSAMHNTKTVNPSKSPKVVELNYTEQEKSYNNTGTIDIDNLPSRQEGKINKSNKNNYIRNRIIASMMVLYLLFVGLGAINTPYVVNEAGKNNPEILSIKLKGEKKIYNSLEKQYTSLYEVMGEVTVIDKNIKSGNSSFEVVYEYEKVLEKIDKALPKIKALDTNSKYNNIKKDISTIYDNLAIYIQKNKTGIMNKNEETIKQGESYKNLVIKDFDTLTITMKDFAVFVKADTKKYEFNNPLN